MLLGFSVDKIKEIKRESWLVRQLRPVSTSLIIDYSVLIVGKDGKYILETLLCFSEKEKECNYYDCSVLTIPHK